MPVISCMCSSRDPNCDSRCAVAAAATLPLQPAAGSRQSEAPAASSLALPPRVDAAAGRVAAIAAALAMRRCGTGTAELQPRARSDLNEGPGLGWKAHFTLRKKTNYVDYYYYSPGGKRYDSRGKVATAL